MSAATGLCCHHVLCYQGLKAYQAKTCTLDEVDHCLIFGLGDVTEAAASDGRRDLEEESTIGVEADHHQVPILNPTLHLVELVASPTCQELQPVVRLLITDASGHCKTVEWPELCKAAYAI